MPVSGVGGIAPVETGSGRSATRLAITWLSASAATDAALARAAATFLGIGDEVVRIVRACRTCGSDQHGKPQVLRAGPGAPVHVSLARSADLAVVAVSDAGPVGVDVEQAGAAELTTWVRVESLVKATGHGLQLDPDAIAVTGPGSAPALLAWPDHEPIGSPVWMFDLDPPAGFSACATVLAAHRPQLVDVAAAPGA